MSSFIYMVYRLEKTACVNKEGLPEKCYALHGSKHKKVPLNNTYFYSFPNLRPNFFFILIFIHNISMWRELEFMNKEWCPKLAILDWETSRRCYRKARFRCICFRNNGGEFYIHLRPLDKIQARRRKTWKQREVLRPLHQL